MKTVRISDIAEEGVSHDPAIRKRVILRNGEIPHLTNFSQARLEPGQSTVNHEHKDMTEVFLVQSGKGVYQIEDQEIALEPGICVVIHPKEKHEVRCTGKEPLVLTYFGIAP